MPTVKIEIKGPIISNDDQWIYDLFDMEATSPKKVKDLLKNAANNDIEVEINSGGGSVFDASEIYTDLKSHLGKVTSQVVGIAASAASVIAMAGDKIVMSPTSQMMIHNASTRSSGDYRDMDHTSMFLKNVNRTIANAYSLKSGKSYEELLAMMDAETWMTPQQALEYGLIDEIMFGSSVPQVVASVTDNMIPQQVIDRIRNEMKAPQTPIAVNNAGEEGKKEENDTMNLEELKNKYPDLFEQAKNEGFTAGVTAENNRIKAIENLAIPGHDDLINKAKFETMDTAETVAVNMIQAQKQQGQNFLQNRQGDAQELNQVPGDSAPEASGKDQQVQAAETGKSIADIINKMRGAVK